VGNFLPFGAFSYIFPFVFLDMLRYKTIGMVKWAHGNFALYLGWEVITREVSMPYFQGCTVGVVFGDLVYQSSTPLTLPLHQERIQVMRSNGVVRRIPAQGHFRNVLGVVRINRKANKRVIEQNAHP